MVLIATRPFSAGMFYHKFWALVSRFPEQRRTNHKLRIRQTNCKKYLDQTFDVWLVFETFSWTVKCHALRGARPSGNAALNRVPVNKIVNYLTINFKLILCLRLASLVRFPRENCLLFDLKGITNEIVRFKNMHVHAYSTLWLPITCTCVQAADCLLICLLFTDLNFDALLHKL